MITNRKEETYAFIQFFDDDEESRGQTKQIISVSFKDQIQIFRFYSMIFSSFLTQDIDQHFISDDQVREKGLRQKIKH